MRGNKLGIHVIPLSIDAPVYRSAAVVNTMISNGWGYIDLEYDTVNKIMNLYFKQNS